MTQVTDNDIKELRILILELDKKISVTSGELSGKIDTNNTKIESLDKRLTESISSLERSIDKRLANQEFIYRAVFIAIVGIIATSALRFLWAHPFF